MAVPVVVLLASPLILVFARTSQDGRRPAPRADVTIYGLMVPAEMLDLGEVWEQDGFTWELPVRNVTTADIRIERIANSCSCTSVEPKSLVVPAGQTRTVRLTISLREKQPSARPAGQARDFSVKLWPTVQGASVGLEGLGSWTLRARVKTLLRTEPRSIDFGRNSFLVQPLNPRQVTVEAAIPLRSLSATIDDPRLSTEVRPDPTGPNRYVVMVHPGRQMSVGSIRGSIRLVPRGRGDEALPSQELPVVGQILNDVQASPPQVAFGIRRVGEEVDDTVFLSSLTGSTFTVKSVKTSSPSQKVVPDETAGPMSVAYRVRQRITSAGEQQGRLVFVIAGPGGQESEVVVDVQYRGMEEKPLPPEK